MKLKNDNFRKSRGGYARLLEISCSSRDKLIGNLTVYEKENRPAYAIKLGTIKKEIIKSD